MHSWLRVLGGAIVAVAAAALLALLVLLALAGTEGGSAWLVRHADRFVPGELEIGASEGVLLSDITLRGVAYRSPTHTARIGTLRLGWRPAALLRGLLHVRRFELSEVRYTGPPAEGAGPPVLPRRSPLPLDLRLDALHLEDVVAQRGEGRYRLTRAELSMEAGARVLEVERLALSAPPVELRLEGRLTFDDPPALEARIAWTAAWPEAPGLEGHGRISGPPAALELEHRITAPFTLETTGTLALDEAGIRVDVTGDWRELVWPLGGEPAALTSNGRYRVRGDLERLVIQLEAQIQAIEPLRTFTLSLDGAIAPAAGYAFEAALAWEGALTDGTVLAGAGQVRGDPAGMEVRHRVTAPAMLETRGRIDLAGKAPSLDLAGTWEGLRWPLAGTPRVQSAQGRYRVRGPLDQHLAVTLSGDVRAADAPFEALHLALDGEARAAAPYPFRTRVSWSGTLVDGTELAGDGRLEGDAQTLRVEHRLERPAVLTTAGRIELGPAPPAVDLEGEWQDLRWPLGASPRYTSARGRYRLQGTLDAYRVQADGRFAGVHLPPVSARLEARGDTTKLDVEALSVEAAQGSASARGRLAWSPHLAWDATLSAQDLNPGMWRPDLPGRLELAARTSGEWGAERARFQVELRRLSGSVRDYPVRGTGGVAFADQRLDLHQLELGSGDNHIRVHGSVAARVDLAFDIDAPKLDQISPAWRGALRGSGRARGPRANPNLSLRVRGEDLGFRDYAADLVHADAQIDPSDATASSVDIRVRALRAGDRRVSEITLEGTGTLASHRLRLRAATPAVRTEMNLSAALATGTWRAVIESGTVDAQPGGVWRLREAQRLTVSARQASASRGCWLQQTDGGRLCFQGEWAAGGDFQASGELVSVPLGLAAPVLPPRLEIEGLVDGRFEAQSTKNRVTAELTLTPGPGLLRYAPPEDEPFETRYRDARLQATYREERLRGEFGVVIAEDGRARGRLEIAPADARGARALSGRVSVAVPDIALFQPFVPRLDALAGTLEAEADLSGTLRAPAVRGEGRLRDGRARLPELGIELAEAELTARSRGGDRIAFEGGVSSGPGRLAVSGELGLDPARGWPLTLALQGERVEVARLAEAQVFVSPDLRVRMQAPSIEVDGTVGVPEAHIRLKELPRDAVRVSRDEVIVDASGEPVPAERTEVVNVVARIEIVLGDDVNFSGFGLRARLDGALEVTRRPGQRTAQGTLTLQEARYKAYGQDLVIERGRLIFAGPMENPALDFRAVRRVQGVTVGLDVGGTLRAPRSRVFSEPPMSETEAFSYLLTGRPLAGASQSDGMLLARAAMALGVERSELLTQQIAQTLGLDELRVESGEVMEESAVVLGKYLTPDLYVGYALGLFDQAGTVRLEYRLTDNWSLEAKSGEAQSMDLIFTIERENLLPPARTEKDLTTEDTEDRTEDTE